jgi:hypothetical protein
MRRPTFALLVLLVLPPGLTYGLVAIGARAQAVLDAAQAGTTLTEIEQLKLDLLRTKTAYAQLLAQHDACKAELGATFDVLGRMRATVASKELTGEEALLVKTVEAAHPGYTFDPKTGTLTKTPPPAPEKK